MNEFKYNQELNETEKDLAKRIIENWDFSIEQLDNFIKQRPIMFIAQLTLEEILEDNNNYDNKHYVLTYHISTKEYKIENTYNIQNAINYYSTYYKDYIFYKLW